MSRQRVSTKTDNTLRLRNFHITFFAITLGMAGFALAVQKLAGTGGSGIVPALESAHAVAYAARVAPSMPLSSNILVNLSGRGDKDLAEVSRTEGDAP